MTTLNLDHQLQLLIDQAPPDGPMPQVMQAIAPVLRAFALRLQRDEFYILQNLSQQWVISVQTDPQTQAERQLIYAFATLDDARLGSQLSHSSDLGVIAVPIPVTHLIFRLMSMTPIDSCVFFPTPGNVQQGVALKRTDIETAIQFQLQQPRPRPVPPDIA